MYDDRTTSEECRESMRTMLGAPLAKMQYAALKDMHNKLDKWLKKGR